MNVLYDLQLSVVDNYDDGNFLMERDSNTNVAGFTLKGLALLHPDWNFYVLVPYKYQRKGEENYSPLNRTLPANVHFKEYKYYGFPFLDRMNFKIRALDRIFENIHIDIMLLNDPTKVLNYKTYFYNKQKEYVPIIVRNHWVSGKLDRKVPEEIDFFIRQVEGAYYSTYATFNSNYAIEIFLENAKEYFNEEFINKIRPKLKAFETVDAEQVRKHYTGKKYEKFTILWGHRLSYYTGWTKTFEALRMLYEKGYNFQVIAPDPGNKMNQEDLVRQYPFILPINKKEWSHKDYLKACSECHAVIGNHAYPATWGGLAITEPMSVGAIPFLLNKYAYKEMFWQYKTNPLAQFVYFSNEKELIKKIGFVIESNVLQKNISEAAKSFIDARLNMTQYIHTLDSLVINSIQK